MPGVGLAGLLVPGPSEASGVGVSFPDPFATVELAVILPDSPVLEPSETPEMDPIPVELLAIAAGDVDSAGLPMLDASDAPAVGPLPEEPLTKAVPDFGAVEPPVFDSPGDGILLPDSEVLLPSAPPNVDDLSEPVPVGAQRTSVAVTTTSLELLETVTVVESTLSVAHIPVSVGFGTVNSQTVV